MLIVAWGKSRPFLSIQAESLWRFTNTYISIAVSVHLHQIPQIHANFDPTGFILAFLLSLPVTSFIIHNIFTSLFLFRSLCREDPLGKEMASHSSILAWRIPWTEEPGRPQSMEVAKSRTRLSDVTLTFHFHALEEEMATHSGILA